MEKLGFKNIGKNHNTIWNLQGHFTTTHKELKGPL
jgi:hypothetical protein